MARAACATRLVVTHPHAWLQSEYGDIYRVTLKYEGESVSEVVVKYFDTIPPCVSLCVLKTGFLFAGCESGNHALYQFIVRSHSSMAACNFVHSFWSDLPACCRGSLMHILPSACRCSLDCNLVYAQSHYLQAQLTHMQ